MKSIILLFLLAISATSVRAQVQRLSQYTHEVSAEIELVEGRLDVSPGSIGTPSLVETSSMTLENGDLIIDYRLSTLGKDQYYKVNFEASVDGQEIKVYREDLMGSISEEIRGEGNLDEQVRWMNLLDRYIDLSGSLTIELQVELWGLPTLPYGIVCGEPPTFTLKQKLPYIITAGVGVGALGASYIFNKKANDVYDNDYLTQNFQESAEPFYQEANDHHQKSLIFRYAGAAILITDAALYIYRSIRHGKKVDAYREFCNDGSTFRIEPVVELNNSLTSRSQMGLKFTYNIGR